MLKATSTKKNESGLVSILITMFLMLVLTLIVLGFAKISQREQRQVLDRQLSTQAFYAAESGVNDAIKVLQTNPTASNSVCDPGSLPSTPALTGQLDNASKTAYTCLIVIPNPKSLQYDTVGTDTSTIIPLDAGGISVDTITINWQASSAPSLPSSASCLSTATITGAPNATGPLPQTYPSPCDAGVLRVDLVPTQGGVDRNNLVSSTMTALLYPSSNGAGSTNYNAQGDLVPAKCTGVSPAPLCTATINLTAGLSSKYYLRIRSIYKANAVTIIAKNGVNPLALTGAQAIIDSTGKANDVLRRIVVRVKTAGDSKGIPDYAIQSTQTICKRIAVNPTSVTVESSPFPGLETPGCQPF